MSDSANKDSADQGFNESELADIMKEIEGLEQDFKSDPESSMTDVSNLSEAESLQAELSKEDSFAEQKHFKETSLQQDIDSEISSAIESADSVETADSVSLEGDEDNVVSLSKEREMRKSSLSAAEGPMQMSFDVSGSMNLKMTFTVNGKTIDLIVDGSDGLSIALPGGVKFSVPVGDEASLVTKKVV